MLARLAATYVATGFGVGVIFVGAGVGFFIVVTGGGTAVAGTTVVVVEPTAVTTPSAVFVAKMVMVAGTCALFESVGVNCVVSVAPVKLNDVLQGTFW